MTSPHHDKRNSPEAGFAVGVLLFAIALIGILAAILAAGGSDFSIAGSTDRIAATVGSQADLIRNTINQCNIDYTTSMALCQTSPSCSMTSTTDPYPSSAVTGTAVSALICNPTGTLSIWKQSLLPEVPNGFADWKYMDAGDAGGRCIWTEPTPVGPDYSTKAYIVNGLGKAAKKFSFAAASDGVSEVNWDPASTAQKFVFWITLPTGTPDTHCTP